MGRTRQERYAVFAFFVVAAPVTMALVLSGWQPYVALVVPSGLTLVGAATIAVLAEATYRVSSLGRREVLLEAQNEVDSAKAAIQGAEADWAEIRRIEDEAMATDDPVAIDEARRDLAGLRRDRVELDNRLGRARRQRDYAAANLTAAQGRASPLRRRRRTVRPTTPEEVLEPSEPSAPTPSAPTPSALTDPTPAPVVPPVEPPEEPFKTFAAVEKQSANRFRLLGFVVLVISAVAAMLFVEFVQAEDDVSAILRKLAPGVPLAILFGYLTREASRHRENELWAQKVATRLESVRPFLDQLHSDEARDAVLLQVGSLAYERDPDPASPSAPAPDQSTLGQVSGLIGQIQALVGAGQPPPPEH